MVPVLIGVHMFNSMFSSDYFVWDSFVCFFGTVLSGNILLFGTVLSGTVLSVHRFIRMLIRLSVNGHKRQVNRKKTFNGESQKITFNINRNWSRKPKFIHQFFKEKLLGLLDFRLFQNSTKTVMRCSNEVNS